MDESRSVVPPSEFCLWPASWRTSAHLDSPLELARSAQHAGADLARLLLQDDVDEPGEMQTPPQTVAVQALRNTRSSRRLRVDEARADFIFSFHAPIVFSAADSACNAMKSSCR